MSSGGRYMAYSPSPSTGPHSPHLQLADHEKYIAELLAEKQKLAPFMQGAGMFHPPSRNWLSLQGNSSGFVVKKTLRMDIPVDKYPDFNFVGRLLGPRGNSLKRVEANTDCRVLIRGRGSIKDAAKEELMRGKPGYEHLNEPLHLVIEAELPAEIVDIRLMQAREIIDDMLKPVDESMDFFKKQQLRELAMLNGTLRDDSSQKSGSLSPFHNNMGMKRAKTRG
nr:unnamed protein product [Digitaria exilis]